MLRIDTERRLFGRRRTYQKNGEKQSPRFYFLNRLYGWRLTFADKRADFQALGMRVADTADVAALAGILGAQRIR